jgi:hypothetical protein
MERRSRDRFPNDERCCGSHIHDIILAQLSREEARAKGPVSANVDASNEDNESHVGLAPGALEPDAETRAQADAEGRARLPRHPFPPSAFDTAVNDGFRWNVSSRIPGEPNPGNVVSIHVSASNVLESSTALHAGV